MSVAVPDKFTITFCRNCGNKRINGNGYGCGPLCPGSDIVEIEVVPRHPTQAKEPA